MSVVPCPTLNLNPSYTTHFTVSTQIDIDCQLSLLGHLG